MGLARLVLHIAVISFLLLEGGSARADDAAARDAGSDFAQLPTTTDDGSPSLPSTKPAVIPEAKHTVWPWVFIAAGSVLVGTSVYFGVSTLTGPCADSNATSTCTPGDRDHASTQASLSTVFSVTGVLAILGGITWYFVEGRSKR